MMFGYKFILFLIAMGTMAYELSAAQNNNEKQLTYHRSEWVPGVLSSQSEKMETYSFEFQNTPLGEALHEIAGRGRLTLLTNSSLIPKNHIVNGELHDIGLAEAFNKVLEHTDLDFLSPGNG